MLAPRSYIYIYINGVCGLTHNRYKPQCEAAVSHLTHSDITATNNRAFIAIIVTWQSEGTHTQAPTQTRSDTYTGRQPIQIHRQFVLARAGNLQRRTHRQPADTQRLTHRHPSCRDPKEQLFAHECYYVLRIIAAALIASMQ